MKHFTRFVRSISRYTIPFTPKVQSLQQAQYPIPPQIHQQSIDILFRQKDNLDDLVQGGKPRGNIQLIQSCYYIRFKDYIVDKVSLKKVPDQNEAYQIAKQKLYQFCFQNDLLLNSYIVKQDQFGKFLQVKVGQTYFKCDLEQLELVQAQKWRHDKTTNYVYSLVDGKKLNFARIILGLEGNQSKVKYIDGDKLNLRRYNLRVQTGVPMSSDSELPLHLMSKLI